MDESRRLAMRRAHARNKMFCTCGATPSGNGGIASHKAMHARRGDGHWGMTYSLWRDVQEGRKPMPAPKPAHGEAG
jgi:hypothetical protein